MSSCLHQPNPTRTPRHCLLQFVLKSGDAKLMVRGSLLGDSQDASIVLNDFPMATLRPLFRWGPYSPPDSPPD